MSPTTTITSIRELDRFTPPGHDPADPAAPVYLIRPASLLERRRWRRDVRATGARYPSDGELQARLRELLAVAQPANLGQITEALDRIAAAADPAAIDPADAVLVAEVEAAARETDPAYATLQADREFYLEVGGLMAARRFLEGWGNVALPFRKMHGLVPEELFGRLPEAHQQTIGWRALALMRPDQDAVKNSASPPPSPPGPALIEAANEPPTAPNGSSSANATS